MALPLDAPPVPHGRTARRLTWQHLPPQVRLTVEKRLGSPVVEARSQGTGFTPGFASRLVAEDGTRVFLKAASRVAQRQVTASYEAEARTLERLTSYDVPAPRLLWADLGPDPDTGWALLGIEDVAHETPQRPWVAAELDRALAGLTDVAAATGGLTPDVLPGLPRLHETFPDLVAGWARIVALSPDDPVLAEAARLAARLPTLEGEAVLHADVRDDNLLLCDDGRTLLCDWAWPCRGPAWVDVVDLLVSAHGDRVDVEPLIAAHPLTRHVPAVDVDTWLAASTAFMHEAGQRPLRGSSPFLGVHARWWAAAAWSWLCARRGW